jgi:hypothetical protein
MEIKNSPEAPHRWFYGVKTSNVVDYFDVTSLFCKSATFPTSRSEVFGHYTYTKIADKLCKRSIPMFCILILLGKNTVPRTSAIINWHNFKQTLRNVVIP